MYTKYPVFLILFVVFLSLEKPAKAQAGNGEQDVIPGRLIARVREEFRDVCQAKGILHPAFTKAISEFGACTVSRVFPAHLPPASRTNAAGFHLVDLSLIFEITCSKKIALQKVIASLKNTGLFEYVEPRYRLSPLFIPDDPKLGSEYYLPRINAFQAWDVEKGDSSVVIGIVDTGTDADHEDLTGNIKYNYNDPIDGIDNDNDTYIDNFMGWDLGDNDNNPQVIPGGGNEAHGVLISGIAAAATHNQVGVAGVGYRCKFLPVKVMESNGDFSKPYEGIVYAADHNCAIINCSWGGPVYAGQFGQDIVNYATFNKNALVIAAAGNDGYDYPYYPASYDNVISVAATDANDEKMYVYPGYASTYGYFIDVCAPGQNVFSTWDYPYFYKSMSGTSMACAVASGAAAIIKSKYPQLSALQLGEKLRVSCDSIDHLPANLPYRSKLGMGRINLYKAVSQDSLSSVRLRRSIFFSAGTPAAGPGDTVSFKAVFQNFLHAATGLSITLRSVSPFVTLIDSVFAVPALSSGDSVNNFNTPFRFVVHANCPPSFQAYFKLIYTDNTHKTFEYTSLLLNPDYLTITSGNIKTTFTSKGRIGYNDNLRTQGCGFIYKNFDSFLASAGVMIGTTYTKVSDAVVNASNTGFDNDFKVKQKVHVLTSPSIADIETLTQYNDSMAGSQMIGCAVTQKTYSWNDTEDEKYVIVEYSIKNTTSGLLNFLYAGLFADWDITTWTNTHNRIAWDSATRTGMTYPVDGWPVLGISLLSNGPVRHYAFDANGTNGSIKLTDGFTSSEKYTALKSLRNTAGLAAGGNDVADLVSTGPFLVEPSDSVVVAFALLAGDYPEEIRDAAVRARLRYHNAIGINDPVASQEHSIVVSPNPFHNHASLNIRLTKAEQLTATVYDLQGRVVASVFSGTLNAGSHTFPVSPGKAGCYLLSVTAGGQTRTFRIINLPY